MKSSIYSVVTGDYEMKKEAKIMGEQISINSEEEDPNIFEASQFKVIDAVSSKNEPIEIPLIKINA